MRIGIIDSDLLDNGTRHPNLALMKLSTFYKAQGHNVELINSYFDIFNPLESYDKIYLSKVFTFTKIPIDLKKYKNIEIGGTGFFLEKAPDLPNNIEHQMPDYHLYDEYVANEIERGIKKVRFLDYLHYSIGFTTRGCFRKCEFCVNKKYDKVIKHSPINEFLDKNRKYIYLWDDNFLGYSKWQETLDDLEKTDKPFQFRQGLDIRLITDEKACRLSKTKYKGEFIFAFDFYKEKDLIEKKLKLWKKYNSKIAKLYVLCAYESQDVTDIVSVFKRIKILMKHHCLPYIMRYDLYKESKYKGMYINLARWCNQPSFFKKKSFREYCEANGLTSSTYKYMKDFEKEYPDIACSFFDIRFDLFGEKKESRLLNKIQVDLITTNQKQANFLFQTV